VDFCVLNLGGFQMQKERKICAIFNLVFCLKAISLLNVHCQWFNTFSGVTEQPDINKFLSDFDIMPHF